MITIAPQHDEDLIAYLARCLESARRHQDTVACRFGDRSFFIHHHASADSVARTWMETRTPPMQQAAPPQD